MLLTPELRARVAKCRLDTAAGLSERFENWMGVLMGCKLSTDRSKILLNTVLCAIRACVRGLRLWGFAHADSGRYWEAIASLMCADDFAGLGESEEEIRKIWHVWAPWELHAGCKFGHKLMLKCGVTGIRYINGKAATVPDPKLVDGRGNKVAYFPYWVAYTHLGKPRRADGVDDDAWKKAEASLRGAIRRLRSMQKPSKAEVTLVSEALLGGTGDTAFDSCYLTWRRAELKPERTNEHFRCVGRSRGRV